MSFRPERDSLGEVNVPADAYYGVQTARAADNFPISGLRAPADLVTATILIKKAAAQANAALGRLDAGIANAIVAAADDILGGALRDQFIVDALKTGRTHLQDAVPMTFGQEFGGYAANVRRGSDDVESAARQLLELNLGATAVGTGLNAGDDYRRLVVTHLARATGLALTPADNPFRVTQ